MQTSLYASSAAASAHRLFCRCPCCSSHASRFAICNLLYCYDSTTQEAMPLETDGDVINYFVYDGHVWQLYRQNDAVRCVVCDIHTGETAELFTISGGMPGIYAETDDNFLVVAEKGILSIAKQDFYRGDFERGTVLVEYS